jgi:hypothetical protein
MRDIRDLLRAVYAARSLAAEGRVGLMAALEELTSALEMSPTQWDERQIVRAAEARCAPQIVEGNEQAAIPILRCLSRVYSEQVHYQQLESGVFAALDALRLELVQRPGVEPGVGTMDQHRLIALAEHLVCLEAIARRLTAPLPEPAFTDSDGRPIKEARHD